MPGWSSGCRHRQIKTAGAADSSLVLARFDGVDRNAEALRRELNQLAQAPAGGDREGRARRAGGGLRQGPGRRPGQAEQLARMHDAIAQFGGNVQTAFGSLRQEVAAKLAELETCAATAARSWCGTRRTRSHAPGKRSTLR